MLSVASKGIVWMSKNLQLCSFHQSSIKIHKKKTIATLQIYQHAAFETHTQSFKHLIKLREGCRKK